MAAVPDVTGAGAPGESIAGRTFARVQRGYDPTEVRAFLVTVADDMAALRARHDELASRLARSEQRVSDLGRRPEPGPGGGESPGPDGAGPSQADADADESELQRRDAELDALVAGMVRRLKRVLQDEHNDLLDRLRRIRGVPTAAALSLPDASLARYADAVRPFVEAASAAGARFVRPSPAGPGRPDAGVEAVVAAVTGRAVAGAVAAIVEPLHRRIGAVLDERGRDAPEVLVTSLASVYREVRSRRVEPLAADVLSAAHAEATWRAAPVGSLLRWIAEDADGPCADCDDNALAGPVARGDAFPTGQLHPPAHLGCRCLLVLTRA